MPATAAAAVYTIAAPSSVGGETETAQTDRSDSAVGIYTYTSLVPRAGPEHQEVKSLLGVFYCSVLQLLYSSRVRVVGAGIIIVIVTPEAVQVHKTFPSRCTLLGSWPRKRDARQQHESACSLLQCHMCFISWFIATSLPYQPSTFIVIGLELYYWITPRAFFIFTKSAFKPKDQDTPTNACGGVNLPCDPVLTATNGSDYMQRKQQGQQYE